MITNCPICKSKHIQTASGTDIFFCCSCRHSFRETTALVVSHKNTLTKTQGAVRPLSQIRISSRNNIAVSPLSQVRISSGNHIAVSPPPPIKPLYSSGSFAGQSNPEDILDWIWKVLPHVLKWAGIILGVAACVYIACVIIYFIILAICIFLIGLAYAIGILLAIFILGGILIALDS